MDNLSNSECGLIGLVMSISNVEFTDFTSLDEFYDFFANKEDVEENDSIFLYERLCTLYFNEDRYSVKNMIKTIYYYYLLKFPDADKLPDEDLINKFISNKVFGLQAINTYYELFFDKEKVATIEKSMTNSKIYQKAIIPYKWEVRGINDFLRENVKSIFNFVLVFEGNREDAAKVTYDFINGSATTANTFLQEKIKIIRAYFPYFVKIMYYDIYKYVSFKETNGTQLTDELYSIIANTNINWLDYKLFDYDIFKLFIDFLGLSGKEREDVTDSLTSMQRRLILDNVPLSALDEF